MRFSAFIVACALCLASEGALRFTEPVWRPDLGFSVPCLAGARGCPLDLPRAESYLVTEDGKQRLEDRFDTFDLWTSQAVRGRWRDEAGNELQIIRLSSLPPDDEPGTVRTRRSFRAEQALVAFDPRRAAHRDAAAAFASPVEIGHVVRPRRAQRRNFTDLVGYSTTNENALVYAFRPRSPERDESPDWFLATLTAAPGERMSEVRAQFDEAFLDRITVPPRAARAKLAKPDPVPGKDATEGDLLLADMRAQVANYDNWACSHGDGVVVTDNLDPALRSAFVAQLTNGISRLRRAYAETIPSPLVGTNAVAAVRVFRSREEYMAYVGVQQKWSAALWSPERRELVLYHADQGLDHLLGEVWHEAFHQYMSYAGALVDSSPWFNEGHSKLFEHATFDEKGRIVFQANMEDRAYIKEFCKELADCIPSLLVQDYKKFYAEPYEDVVARYRLAWSIAYFLEIGAPELRFQPYKDLRADYMKTLVKTRSMAEATGQVLGEKKSRDAFVAAWLAFWRRQ